MRFFPITFCSLFFSFICEAQPFLWDESEKGLGLSRVTFGATQDFLYPSADTSVGACTVSVDVTATTLLSIPQYTDLVSINVRLGTEIIYATKQSTSPGWPDGFLKSGLAGDITEASINVSFFNDLHFAQFYQEHHKSIALPQYLIQQGATTVNFIQLNKDNIFTQKGQTVVFPVKSARAMVAEISPSYTGATTINNEGLTLTTYFRQEPR